MPLRADLASLRTWGFADPGPLLERFRIVEQIEPDGFG
jgi:hypothetical protein